MRILAASLAALAFSSVAHADEPAEEPIPFETPEPTPTPAALSGTRAEGAMIGREDASAAESKYVTDGFVEGCATGFFGVISLGACYIPASKAEPPLAVRFAAGERSPEFLFAYDEAYKERLKERRRSAKIGGVVTALGVVVLGIAVVMTRPNDDDGGGGGGGYGGNGHGPF